MFGLERDSNDIARDGVKRTVFDVLRAEHGTDAIAHRPITPRTDLTHPTPADYAAGIAAARKVAGHAQRLLIEYATAARGEGVSWQDLAGPLGIEPGEYGYTDLAVEAFEAVASDPLMMSDRRRTSWRCAGPNGCGEVVTDYGPYDNNPADDESGHAEGCARHQADIDACIARNR